LIRASNPVDSSADDARRLSALQDPSWDENAALPPWMWGDGVGVAWVGHGSSMVSSQSTRYEPQELLRRSPRVWVYAVWRLLRAAGVTRAAVLPPAPIAGLDGLDTSAAMHMKSRSGKYGEHLSQMPSEYMPASNAGQKASTDGVVKVVLEALHRWSAEVSEALRRSGCARAGPAQALEAAASVEPAAPLRGGPGGAVPYFGDDSWWERHIEPDPALAASGNTDHSHPLERARFASTASFDTSIDAPHLQAIGG